MFDLAGFLIYCFLCAYTPGANNLLSMAYASRLGIKRSIKFNFGITMGFFIVMAICTTFTATLYALMPKVQIVLQVLGAAYMLYLAWKIYKSDGELNAEEGSEASFLSGMLLQFMNPKIYIYCITAISLYVMPVYNSVPWLCFFVLVLTVIGASGSYVWALFGAAFCSFFRKHTKAVNIVMALLLVYCAVSLFL